MPSLFAVVESHFDSAAGAPVSPPEQWVRLSAAPTPDDLERFFTSARLAKTPRSASRKRVLGDILSADCMPLSGGLAASDGHLTIYPSCCCGLESWREWLTLLSNSGSPWLGHDPSPWVEARQDQFLVWADGGLGEKSDPTMVIAFTRFELSEALVRVQLDLQAFRDRLSEWAAVALGDSRGQLARLFDRQFQISHFQISHGVD
jgi:hypothetical protein